MCGVAVLPFSGVERVWATLRGRERGHADRRHAPSVDGQTRRADEHEQGVRPARPEKTEKSDRANRGARHSGADRQETRVRRRVPAQEPDAHGIRAQGSDRERRRIEFAQAADAVRCRTQTVPAEDGYRGGQKSAGRQEPAGPRHLRRYRHPRGEDGYRQVAAREETRRPGVQEEAEWPIGCHRSASVRRISADQVRDTNRRIHY